MTTAYTPEQLAKEAGFNVDNGRIYTPCAWDNNVTEEVLALVKLAVQAEREECAKICDTQHDKALSLAGAARADACSCAIRARGIA